MTSKFIHVNDMTPEQRAEHQRIMDMLSPKVIFREEHRKMLIEEDEDPNIADECYNNQ